MSCGFAGSRPIVGVFRPPNRDGCALLSLPGGGCEFLSIENEGFNIAKMFGIFIVYKHYSGVTTRSAKRSRRRSGMVDVEIALKCKFAGMQRNLGIDHCSYTNVGTIILLW